MADEHLLNIIKKHCRNIQEATALIEENQRMGVVLKASFDCGYQSSLKMLEARIKMSVEALPDYVFEAVIRGLITEEMKLLLQATMQRKSAVRSINHWPLKGAKDVEDVEEVEDEDDW